MEISPQPQHLCAALPLLLCSSISHGGAAEICQRSAESPISHVGTRCLEEAAGKHLLLLLVDLLQEEQVPLPVGIVGHLFGHLRRGVDLLEELLVEDGHPVNLDLRGRPAISPPHSPASP